MFPESLCFWEILKSEIIEDTFPSTLFKYTLQLAKVYVLETHLETILWKAFQLSRRILNDIGNITKASMLIVVEVR